MGTRTTFRLCIASVVLLGALSAGALATDYDDKASGYWNSTSTWDPAGWPGTDGDTALIDSNIVTMNQDTLAGVSITFGGGSMRLDSGFRTCNSPIDVTAPSFFLGAGDYAGTKLELAGTITGSSLLTSDPQARSLQVSSSNPTFSGGWQVNSAWVTALADMALGSGTVTIDGGGVGYLAAQSYGSGGNPPIPDVIVNSGGMVRLAATGINLDVALDGGAIYSDSRNGGADPQYARDIQVLSESTFTGRLDYGGSFSMYGQFIGSAKMNVERTAYPLNLYAANPSFSGGWDIQSAGRLYVRTAGGLGTGAVDVSGTLYFYQDEAAPPAISVHDGGEISNEIPRAGGAATFSGPFTMDGGTISGRSDCEYSGTITLATDSYVDAGFVSGKLTGPGKLTKTGTSTVHLLNAGNDFAGGTEVAQGTLDIDAAGALGPGTAVAKGGTLRTNAAGSLDSPAAVIADEDGTLDINSTETGAFTVKTYGALKISAGGLGSTIDYGVGGNAVAEAGCVFDISAYNAGMVPADDSEFATGDGGYGGFLATTVGTWTVGKYSGTIYRGLAATSGAPTFSGEVIEAPGSPAPTEGVGMLALGPATLKFSGAKITTQGTNTIKLQGKGSFQIVGAANIFNNDLDMQSSGQLKITSADGVSGRTVYVNNGSLDLDDAAALNNATAYIGAGAGFNVDRDVSAGTVHVEDGGGVYITGESVLGGGATWDFQAGSQVVIAPRDFAGALPGPGKSSYLLTNGDAWYRKTFTSGVVLGDDTRLTIAPDASDNPPSGSDKGCGLSDTSGPLTLATGSTQCRVTGVGSAPFWLNNQVDLTIAGGAGKLIVGDADDFPSLMRNATGFVDLPQDGMVYLNNKTNVIGEIDIQAGTLVVNWPCDKLNLGGATRMHIAAGAAFYIAGDEWSVCDPAMIIWGTGTVLAGWSRTSTLRLQPAWDGSEATDAGLSPGESAGILSVDGKLNFAQVETNPGEYAYSKLIIDVVSAGTGDEVAGVDHDQVTGTSSITGLGQGELVLNLPLPSGVLDPNDLGAMTILQSTGSTISGGQLTGVSLGAGTDDHWVVTTDSLDYTDNTKVVLTLSRDNWTGFGGDADLNGLVNYLDLGVLATYYDQTGMGWGEGDFTFDGKVDYMDLGILATNYDLTEGSGGAPVPEPAFAVLLGAGVVGLLRRRRRR